MKVSRRGNFRTRLSFEHLEDRMNPSALLAQDFTSFASGGVLVDISSNKTSSPLETSPLAQNIASPGGNSYLVSLNEGVTVGQAITHFSEVKGVLSVGLDYAIRLESTPNDPAFGSLWGMKNAGQNGGVAGADIDATTAWDKARGTGGTIVAVIDTGVEYTHSDLAANIWTNTREVTGDGIDNDGNGYVDDIHGDDFVNNDGNPIDDNGHGTRVAGTIGAVGTTASA